MPQKTNVTLASDYILERISERPKLALILGSGLGNFGSKINVSSIFDGKEIPYYPHSSVPGHAGRVIFGYIENGTKKSLPLIVFQGRVHFYECESIERVTFPLLLAKRVGIEKLIVTNAAGGINKNFNAGELMLIKDIINLSSLMLPRFSSLNRFKPLFNKELQRIVKEKAASLGIPLREGTYCWLKGPSYETPSEIQMLKKLGVDAVGMSTVPEIFTASGLNIETVGISLISNMGAGISPTKLSHSEVTETANAAQDHFSNLISHIILSIP